MAHLEPNSSILQPKTLSGNGSTRLSRLVAYLKSPLFHLYNFLLRFALGPNSRRELLNPGNFAGGQNHSDKFLSFFPSHIRIPRLMVDYSRYFSFVILEEGQLRTTDFDEEIRFRFGINIESALGDVLALVQSCQTN